MNQELPRFWVVELVDSAMLNQHDSQTVKYDKQALIPQTAQQNLSREQ